MKKNELNQRIESVEKELDNMEILSASEEWTNALMERLQTVRTTPQGNGRIHKGTVAVGLIAIINLTMILSYSVNAQRSSDDREDKLKLVSREILINPTSIKD